MAISFRLNPRNWVRVSFVRWRRTIRSANAALDAAEPVNWPINNDSQAARETAGPATDSLCLAPIAITVFSLLFISLAASSGRLSVMHRPGVSQSIRLSGNCFSTVSCRYLYV